MPAHHPITDIANSKFVSRKLQLDQTEDAGRYWPVIDRQPSGGDGVVCNTGWSAHVSDLFIGRFHPKLYFNSRPPLVNRDRHSAPVA